MAHNRLQREYEMLFEDPIEGLSAGPREDNIYVWDAIIMGPEDSPYQCGIFNLIIEFNKGYPFKPPIARFTTPIYHPNVDRDGNICLDILKKQWSPALKISDFLMSIRSLLDDPNPDDPLNAEAANLYVQDRVAYDRRVQEDIARQ